MPIPFLRQLSGKHRSTRGNRQLGLSLAFVAGAVNAGGFLAVARYTSHMTGIVASMAEDLAAWELAPALAAVGAVLAFTAGAACSALVINWTRRRSMHSEYALALLLEAVLMLGFGLLGSHLAQQPMLLVPVTVGLLCFMMGLQNAIVTKLTLAEIRTTHVTGLITDIGIELGKLAYWNGRDPDPLVPPVRANRVRLGILTALLALFFIGSVVGAVAFRHVGFLVTVPLAVFLLMLAAVPVFDDLNAALARSPR